MAKTVNYYECEFCGQVLKTLKGIGKHEAKCSKNSVSIKAVETANKNLRDELESARLTSSNICDFLKSTQESFLKYGIKISFGEYPSEFHTSVSNSHNAPIGYKTNWCARDDGEPRGYPGWSGRWEGTVEVLDASILKCDSYVSMNDLRRYSQAFNTGSGSGGQKFSISGMLWLYDFPIIRQEYEELGHTVPTMRKDYTDLLYQYHDKFKKARENFVGSDREIQQIDYELSELNALSAKLGKIRQAKCTALQNDFSANWVVELPTPPSAFCETKKIREVQCEINYTTNSVHPECQKTLEGMKKTVKRITDFVDRYPEAFV